MKTSLLSWSMVLVATALVACGDDTTDTSSSGSGGAGGGTTSSTSGSPTSTTTTTTSTGSPTTTTTTSTSSSSDGGGGSGQGGDTTTSSTSSQGGDDTTSQGGGGSGQGGDTTSQGGGGSGQGGDNGCVDIEFTDIAFDQGAYLGGVDPALGGAGDDFGVVVFDHVEQTIDLSLTDGATSSQYIFAGEDFDPKVGYAAVYLSNGGTLTVAEDGWSFEGVTLQEINLEDGSFVDGNCYNVADASGDLGQGLIPGEWACNPDYYDAADGCDCLCGAPDPDCDIPNSDVFGCAEGQTCSDDGSACEGVPTAWTCAEADYGDGTTCDCACGTGDPDCDGANPVEGCAVGQSCSAGGLCLDPESVCDDLTDNDEDGRIDCDDATSCSAVLAPASCLPGLTAIGLGCDAATDCTGLTGGPICLTEADVGLPGGQCGEWCDLANDGCPNGTQCADFGVERGICAPSCDDDSDCDNAEAVCTAEGICVAGGVPGAWLCDPGFYGAADGCDCGCGVIDPDCADADDTTCEYCSADSCGNDGTEFGCDLAEITDDNNAVCE